MGKGEIARNEQFLLFQQSFQLNQIIVHPCVHIFYIISLFAAELVDWLTDWMVFYAAFNSISVISRQQITLSMLSWVSPVLGWALKCLAQGHSREKTQRIQCGSNPGPLDYESNTLPLSHVGPRAELKEPKIGISGKGITCLNPLPNSFNDPEGESYTKHCGKRRFTNNIFYPFEEKSHIFSYRGLVFKILKQGLVQNMYLETR